MRAVTLALALFLSSMSSLAQTASQNILVFSYHELDLLAKAAMTDEANFVNAFLDKGDSNIPGYKAKDVQFLQKMGKTKIAPSYLFNKCIMSEKSLAAVLSSTLTQDNDSVGPQIGSLANVKTAYNKTIWKLTSRMCENSRTRFAQRLSRANWEGHPLNLNSKTNDAVSQLVFFPVNFGKPSFTNTLRGDAMILLSGGFFVGAILSLTGNPIAGIVISIASLGTNGLALQGSIPKAENALRNLNFSLISKEGAWKLDLADDEKALEGAH